MVLHFARDTNVTSCGSSSLKKAVVDVYDIHADVVPIICYTLTSWLWLPADVSKLLASVVSRVIVGRRLPNHSAVTFSELPVTKVPVGVNST